MAGASRIDGIEETAFNDAVAVTVDLLRGRRPDLDLRVGTAIRSLVVEPAAIAASALAADIAGLRSAMSIASMSAAGDVGVDEANAVLSNFGVSRGIGSRARGVVRVVRSSYASTAMAAGTKFTDGAGMSYTSVATVYASVDPVGSEVPIIGLGNGEYYYVVDVVADAAGEAGNIVAGTALSPSVSVGGMVMCDAYSDFTGGTDGESLESAVARIPSAIAYRGLTNSTSVQAVLESRYSGGQIRAVSCTGYMDRSMLRDKHNDLGVSVGGRSDVYVRTFDSPEIVTLILDGDVVERRGSDEATYSIDIPAEYASFYAVRRVCRAKYEDIKSSLEYRLVRGHSDSAGMSGHDILVSDSASHETAWSAWQSGRVLAYDSTYYLDAEGVSKEDALPDSAQFKVELYYSSGIEDMQAIVDDPSVRNVAADHVVRTPPVCIVGVVATVSRRAGFDVSESVLEKAVAGYVNSRSFVGSITRSEIASVLMQAGAGSVDLGPGGMQLTGRVCGADGEWYLLEGDRISVDGVGPDEAMISAKTVVFAAEPSTVHVRISG